MPVEQNTLTAEQLAAAYNRMSVRERRSFLSAVVEHPAHQAATRDLLKESQAVLERKFPPTTQRELDRLLSKNSEGKLTPAERRRLEQLVDEYGAGLVEKARAQYVLTLAQSKRSTT